MSNSNEAEIKKLEALLNADARNQQRQGNQQALVVGCAILALGGFIAFGGGKELLLQQLAQDSALRQATATEQQLLREDKVARRRLETAHLMVFLDDRSKYVRLSPDLLVVDPITGHPLPDDTVIADLDGRTAIVKDGYPTQIMTAQWESITEHREWLRERMTADQWSAVFTNLTLGADVQD